MSVTVPGHDRAHGTPAGGPLLLYAVTPSGSEAHGAVAGTRLHEHPFGDLTILAGARAEPHGNRSRELLAFARVLQHLWSRTVLLPVRFGETTHAVECLERLVHAHRGEWLAHLDRIRGHRECVVQVQVGAGPGCLGLEHAMAPYASDVRTLPRVHAGEARLSFLVRDEMVEAARSAVACWSGGRAGFTGPWPPYSFSREVSL